MKPHNLKTWPEYFQAIKDGTKTFEVRKNDRDFKVGDKLDLVEYMPDANKVTGRTLLVEVDCIIHGGQFGIEPGYCVMGIRLVIEEKPRTLLDFIWQPLS